MNAEEPSGRNINLDANVARHAWEAYKLKAEVAKNFASIVAIIVGGGWILYTFVALKQIEIAEAQIGQTFSRLSIEIKAAPEETPEGTCLVADVFITNVGTKPVSVSSRWGKPLDAKKPNGKLTYHPPLAVHKVQFESSGEVKRYANQGDLVLANSLFGHPLTVPAKSSSIYKDDKTHAATVTWELIRVGETRKIPFVVKLDEPGVYLVAYRIFVGFDEKEQKIYREFTGRVRNGATWSSRTYVTVNEVQNVGQSESGTQASTLENSLPLNQENLEAAEEEEEEE